MSISENSFLPTESEHLLSLCVFHHCVPHIWDVPNSVQSFVLNPLRSICLPNSNRSNSLYSWFSSTVNERDNFPPRHHSQSNWQDQISNSSVSPPRENPRKLAKRALSRSYQRVLVYYFVCLHRDFGIWWAFCLFRTVSSRRKTTLRFRERKNFVLW